ncbi:MAG: hypothetical protein EBT03_09110, partial [Betaproteobacteria bacterium]|nr:hypothetical protein [Betaproteobacteria bacterium]
KEIQKQAKEAYGQFTQDSKHPGLQFKQLHPTLPVWSVRVSASYRAVRVRTSSESIVWSPRSGWAGGTRAACRWR